MKSKFIKFVSVLCVLIIIASSSLVAFADDDTLWSGYISDLNKTFGDTIIDCIFINALDSSGNYLSTCNVEVLTAYDHENGMGVQVKLKFNEWFEVDNIYGFDVYLKINRDIYLDDSKYVTGSFTAGLANTRFRILDYGSGSDLRSPAHCYRQNGTDFYYQMGTIDYFSTNYTYYARANYPMNRLGETYELYCLTFVATPVVRFQQFSLFLFTWDFDVFTESEYSTNMIISNQDENTNKIINNQNENTDKILNAGSDVAQPDFDSTNNQLDSTVGEMQSIEGNYEIDQVATQAALDEGNSFMQGTDLQQASVQVKKWIETFSSDNNVYTSFLIACMCLGLCFWIIGRKAYSE